MNTPILLTCCIVAILKMKGKPKFNKGTTMALENVDRKYFEKSVCTKSSSLSEQKFYDTNGLRARRLVTILVLNKLSWIGS